MVTTGPGTVGWESKISIWIGTSVEGPIGEMQPRGGSSPRDPQKRMRRIVGWIHLPLLRTNDYTHAVGIFRCFPCLDGWTILTRSSGFDLDLLSQDQSLGSQRHSNAIDDPTLLIIRRTSNNQNPVRSFKSKYSILFLILSGHVQGLALALCLMRA
ncbi:uncharacterized protein BDW47DRAFT_39842 [Aspergillus candidus]|uniref:Uncharacterized protein n=1 Tax=Aspergillus candidus TaxID=41067 RepID=A0A2I2F8Z8_ASPCN|nr:hypothetical protein BDW47DRAFT_39842 [Aspergillus candidus]PLB37107.1 hypothetical protein BDW47DRAFT_39842 [Aspergillus candidus]